MDKFSIKQASQAARIASNDIARLSHASRKSLLYKIAELIIEYEDEILAANKIDIQNAKDIGLSAAMLDRLALDSNALSNISSAVRSIAEQDDVLGNISQLKKLASGIQVGKMKIPLGVIAMIYESRPNVTIDAAVLCLKAGNAVILRGGKEAQASNQAFAKVLHDALSALDLPTSIVTVIPDPSRDIMTEMLTLSESIDLIIPRGGEGLIRYVSENSRIPVIQHFKGVCHLYVDEYADLQKALNILENGKTQRTGVCNALETLLVHADIAPKFLAMAEQLFSKKGVKVHACEQSISGFSNCTAATAEDWEAEYLALEIAVKVVSSYEDAISHILAYGSGHTEVIVTEKISRAQAFLQDVPSSVVMVNASSRFSDGGELGLGAEIGISTSKLHAYGPMGAESLTTEKFIVLGDGHIRQ